MKLFSEIKSYSFLKHKKSFTGYQDVTGAFYDILENKFFKRIFDEERDLTFVDVALGLTDVIIFSVVYLPCVRSHHS